MFFGQTISSQRKRLGLSQSELAFQSKVSLPTIQKLEAGTGNPSLETMEALLLVLGYSISFHPREADWEFLQACGLPLTGHFNQAIKPNKERLQQEIRLALTTLKEEGRKKESLLALLLALKTHYPSIYKPLEKSELVRDAEIQLNQPKLIKLKRIALSKLSKFL
ncbi:MAG: helix-turn-helix domain-containing protein [Pseudomonadota bacterium]